MQYHRSLPALAALLVSACFDPRYPPNRPCGEDGWCPPGQDCIDMVCRLPGYVPPRPDASVLDGAVSDGPVPDATPPAADNADLAELSLSVPGLGPAFTPATTEYDLHVSTLVRSLRVTARPVHPDATLTIAGQPATPGQPSLPVAVAPSTMAVSVTVTPPEGAEKTYLVTVHKDGSVAEHVYGKADNADLNDTFGWRVVIDGDTLAVSAPGEASCATGVHALAQTDDGCPSRGAVYVFRRCGSEWELEAYLKPSRPGDSDEFGIGLALDGDTLVAGAFHDDGMLDDSGAAYVFRRVSGQQGNTCSGDEGWIEEGYLKPMDPQAGQDFGWSVAVTGDLVAVGARRENGGSATDSGAVYLFRRDQDGWNQEARLAAEIPETNAFFGYSVAAAEDVVVVGACGDGCPPGGGAPPDPQATGTAYVFRREGTSWRQEAELASLASPSPQSGDAFGFSVALAGDGDTAVIGAPLADESFGNVGAVHVFRNAGNTWSPEAYLDDASTEDDNFGTSVAIAGTLMTVGAAGKDDRRGMVYLYERSGAAWGVPKYIDASNRGEGDEFGWSVALSDDALVVGARFQDGSGAVYLFH